MCRCARRRLSARSVAELGCRVRVRRCTFLALPWRLSIRSLQNVVSCAQQPCRRRSRSRSRPVRDVDSPLGFADDAGHVPDHVQAANRVVDCAAAAMQACFDHNGFFIAETPVSRGAGSPFGIKGREKHINQFQHPSILTLRNATGAASSTLTSVAPTTSLTSALKRQPSSLCRPALGRLSHATLHRSSATTLRTLTST